MFIRFKILLVSLTGTCKVVFILENIINYAIIILMHLITKKKPEILAQKNTQHT